MKTYGLTKKIKFNYNGEEDFVVFKSSVALLGLYKSLFGTDLVHDVLSFLRGFKIDDLQKIKNIDVSKEIEDYSEEELKILLEIVENNTSKIDTTILLQIIVALILNAVPPYERPGLPDALDIVPPSFLTDKTIMEEAITLILPFISEKKK